MKKAVIESLEVRRLLSVAMNINFQPSGAATPAGYLADTGVVYANRGNGYSYGWSFTNTSYTRDRNSKLSPDQRYDTLNFMQKTKNTNATWEIALPNDTYTIHLVAGDPADFASVYRINAEGTLVLSGTPTSSSHWIESTATVQVKDGRLTITPGSGAVNDKICFIDIKSSTPTPTPTPTPTLATQIADTLAFAKTQMLATLNEIGNKTNVYIERTIANGTWKTQGAAHWESGFLPGIMWQLYQNTGDTAWRDKATAWTLGIAGQTGQDDDIAFRFMPSFKPLYDLTGNASYRQTLLDAAAEKNSHWNQTVGAFETTWYKTTSGDPKANFAVQIDVMTDMELLYWAAAQTGNQQYIDRANKHMETILARNVHADGSVTQFAMYDRATGNFVRYETYHGYSATSTWARGQAWAMLAFPDIAKATGRADFLAAAQKVADWFISHTPADGVPYWDFNDPAIPNTYRDSSAAAIAASGLLKLAAYLGKTTTAGAKYYAAAEKILTSLTSSAYLARGTINHGILTHGVALYNKLPESRDASLSFGDYYLLQAINEYQAM